MEFVTISLMAVVALSIALKSRLNDDPLCRSFSRTVLKTTLQVIVLQVLGNLIQYQNLWTDLCDPYLNSIYLFAWFVVYFSPWDFTFKLYRDIDIIRQLMEGLVELNRCRIVGETVEALLERQMFACEFWTYTHAVVASVFKGNSFELVYIVLGYVKNSTPISISSRIKASILVSLLSLSLLPPSYLVYANFFATQTIFSICTIGTSNFLFIFNSVVCLLFTILLLSYS